MFIKKKIYETASKETWSVATPLIATDYAGHTGFFWQESVLLIIQGQKPADAFGADVSRGMYVYSPYTICLRNWLTQACARNGFAYAGLLWHDSFNSHQGRLWKMLMPPERLKVTQLMSTWPHVQEARERFKKISLGDFVWCVVFLQSSE